MKTILICSLVLLVYASGSFAAITCPPMPAAVTEVNRDVSADIKASAASLGRVKAGEVATKTEVTAKNLFEKYPNVDKLLALQTMAATYCAMLRDATAMSDREKLERWEKFQEKVLKLQSGSFDTKAPKGMSQPPKESLQNSFVTKLTVWAEIDAGIYVDGKKTMHIDHRTGFDYSGAKVRVTPNSVMTLKAGHLKKDVSLWSLCDSKSEECQVRVGTQQLSDIQLSKEEKRAAMGDSSDIAKLLKELFEEIDSSSRAWAAERLGYIGDKAAVDGLLRALQDSDPWVQAQVADALGRIADPSALPNLEKAYAAYDRKESYGYIFEAAIRNLRFAAKQKEN